MFVHLLLLFSFLLTPPPPLVDQIKSGRTTVGNLSSPTDGSIPSADIKLSGDNILPEHCYFECGAEDGKVTLHAIGKGITMVNGLRISPEKVR